MTDQATRQSIRQFTADPQAPKGRMLRALERSGVDVLGDHARRMEDWGMSHCVRVEAFLIDEERGVVAVGETHEKLELSARRKIDKYKRLCGESDLGFGNGLSSHNEFMSVLGEIFSLLESTKSPAA